jgi:hypothetical protein
MSIALILLVIALVLAILAAFSLATRVPLLAIAVILVCVVQLFGARLG